MKTRAGIIFGLLTLIVALPMALRRESATTTSRGADDSLVILSPHNQSIRQEFGEAFATHWKKTTGRSLYIDWRTPGGTSEIRMVLDAGFKAAEETKRPGIGVDVFFGGGEPDFASQAKMGRLVKLDVFETHPGYFASDGPIPETFTGERYYPADHVWVATGMSQFGICYNPDVLRRLRVPSPTVWNDLGDPRYAGTLALADPTKSGSVARTFELLVQGEMQRELAVPGTDRNEAIAKGWDSGLRLIQRMSANARYFTDSASKVPLDVGQGNSSAGMCIDFYGRSFSEKLGTASGTPRVLWIAPVGGTTLSGDPVAVLKGAPHPEIAQKFVEFLLTPEAQRLWFTKPSQPGGPKNHPLHRLPIRRDSYTPENLAASTMPAAKPYEDPANFTYRKELTGATFNTLRQLVKIMCIDSHEEMKSAWLALRDAGMPADALAVFSDVSRADYARMGKGDPILDGADALKAAEHATELGEWFRANYRRAEAMAKSSTATTR
ncbi:extracellular solute-binding protein [Luteolibacter yonseiensis]|uniref:Extracellular solute-binding protein n=1 Tax=Luteolibacter yonseiensis TaxID=1144680 RepID=A0A934QX16_9BACT|nr:extracellular solute-binding protein [Luteolibacter yonseiensis]MBK1814293.1 extracellular solute-binding protein [Luteolibacter yonseiensis]